MQKNKTNSSKCPVSMKALFEVANSLPQEFSNPVIENFTNQRTFVELSDGHIQTQKLLFYEAIETLPKTFIDADPCLRAFLNGETTDFPVAGWLPVEKRVERWLVEWAPNPRKEFGFSPFNQLQDALRRVNSIRKNLRLAIKYSVPRDPYYGLVIADQIQKMSITFTKHFIPSQEIHFGGMEVIDGFFEVKFNETFSVIVNERIDTKRIKECQKCSRFFWAKRIGKGIENKACEKCAVTERQKKFLTEKKDLVNARRSKSRFDKLVEAAEVAVKAAKNDIDKIDASNRLQSAITKRTKAAQQLQRIKKQLKEEQK